MAEITQLSELCTGSHHLFIQLDTIYLNACTEFFTGSIN